MVNHEQANPGMRFEVFVAMKIQVMVFWVMMLCSDVVVCNFGGSCCLHLQTWSHNPEDNL